MTRQPNPEQRKPPKYTTKKGETTMTREFIEDRQDDIIVEMAKADADAYRNNGAEFRVYIDSDGKIGTEEWVAGDNGYFRFHDPDYERV